MSAEPTTEMRTLTTEREELTCPNCGLVYQQTVKSPIGVRSCPRCNIYPTPKAKPQ